MAQMELGLITGLTLSEKRIFMETRSPYIFDKIDQMHKVWPAIKLIADSHVTKPCILGTLKHMRLIWLQAPLYVLTLQMNRMFSCMSVTFSHKISLKLATSLPSDRLKESVQQVEPAPDNLLGTCLHLVQEALQVFIQELLMLCRCWM